MSVSGREIEVTGPEGLIETRLDLPAQGAAPLGVAVLCHPHPLYGGTLDNKVVHTLARTMNELGLAALRFNFRGVGASRGRYAEGIGEQDDLRAVLDAAGAYWPGLPLWLGGFSFGAYVSVAVAAGRPPAQLVSIAPPVNLFDFTAISRPDCPWLIVQGGADDIVPAPAVRHWLEGLDVPPAYVELADAGHFFHGRLNQLRELLLGELSAPRSVRRT